MGLPVALGTKTVSSYQLSSPEPIEEFAAPDGRSTVLCPGDVDHQDLCMATDGSTLQAIFSISYYDMLRESSRERDHTVAEVRVQILPAAEPLATSYRETVFRLTLKESEHRKQNVQPFRAQAILSADRRFVTCLVPFPTSARTHVVVFQLRRPRSGSVPSLNGPQLPSYISTTNEMDPVTIPVATNPRVLKHSDDDNRTLSHASCICNAQVNYEEKSSLLFVGCWNGDIMAVSYRPLTVLGIVHHGSYRQGLSTTHQLQCMDHVVVGHSGGGRLVTIDGKGNARVFQTQVKTSLGDSTTDTSERSSLLSGDLFATRDRHGSALAINFTEGHKIRGPFSYAKWVASGSYLALMEHPHESCRVQVFGLYAGSHAVPVSEIDYTRARLRETMHATYYPGELPARTSPPSRELNFMDYDAACDCLAISSCLYKQGASDAPFVSLWHWRSNTQGLTIASGGGDDDYSSGTRSLSPLLQYFFFCRDKMNALKLSHTLATGAPRPSPGCIRQDLFQVGILSPPHCRSVNSASLQRPCPLILSAKSISYPRITKKSARSDYEIDWAEASLPFHYISSFGAATIATIGKVWGRSVAMAGENGMCTLDVGNEVSYQSRKHPKWHRFASDLEERSFQVLAMAWWEGEQEVHDEVLRDDVVVAIISVDDGRDKVYYLSSWSKRRLGVGHQLLRNCADKPSLPRWGLRLPQHFCPTRLDLLVQPSDSTTRREARKAIVLLADDSPSVEYKIFQLQVVSRHVKASQSYRDVKPYDILGRCASHGDVGSDAHLFVSGASFSYDLTLEGNIKRSYEFVATLGVVRSSGGGMDAFALSSKRITHVGQVVADYLTCNQNKRAEVSACWLSDVVIRSGSDTHDIDGFVWTIHLMNGTFLRWTVPCIVDTDGLEFMTSSVVPPRLEAGPLSVHPKSICLGLVSTSGSASQWMQISAAATGSEFPLGPINSSSLTCMVGVSQECHKFHRSLGENFESQIFRSDFLKHECFCPGSFSIHPPAFLPVLYSFLVDSMVSGQAVDDGNPVCSYVNHKLSNGACFESSMMALQLLSLRLVEKLAASQRENSSDGHPPAKIMFGAITHSLRLHVTPLQFASLFLEVGRQLEPSCFPHLFPLPVPPQHIRDCDSLEHLFDRTLEQGSASLAIAALPLFSNYDVTLSMCRSIFHLGISRLGLAMHSGRENFSSFERGKRVSRRYVSVRNQAGRHGLTR